MAYQNNPNICVIRRKDFNLEVLLFASACKGSYGYHLYGESIIISKPVARQLAQDLETIEFRNVIVPLIGREYSARVSVSKERGGYKIMDNERTMVLGQIYGPAFIEFAGEDRNNAAVTRLAG